VPCWPCARRRGRITTKVGAVTEKNKIDINTIRNRSRRETSELCQVSSFYSDKGNNCQGLVCVCVCVPRRKTFLSCNGPIIHRASKVREKGCRGGRLWGLGKVPIKNARKVMDPFSALPQEGLFPGRKIRTGKKRQHDLKT